MTVYFQLQPPFQKNKKNKKYHLWQRTISPSSWHVGRPQKKNVRVSDGPLAQSELLLCCRIHLKHLSCSLQMVPDTANHGVRPRPQLKDSPKRKHCLTRLCYNASYMWLTTRSPSVRCYYTFLGVFFPGRSLLCCRKCHSALMRTALSRTMGAFQTD